MKTAGRLFSLDLLRGFDMFLLTVIGPLVVAAHRVWKLPPAFMDQFDHHWGGFTLWDIIMPLFIFLAGVSVPFALTKRLPGSGDATKAGKYWRHVFVRVALLWFGGLLVQGELATLDPLRINYFNNTLQSIAVGYLIAAACFALPKRKILCPVMAFVLALVYGILLHTLGDYSPHGNFAALVEGRILTAILPVHSTVLAQFNNPASEPYTWYLTSLMFGSMALCGVGCGTLLADHTLKPGVRSAVLLGGGANLLVIGLSLGGGETPFIPAIKHIYTVSFTAQAMGWCLLALALLEMIPATPRIQRAFSLIVLYGKCALTAYMVSHFFNPALRAAAATIAQGVPRFLGDACQPFVVAVVSAILLTFVLVVRLRLRTSRRAVDAERPRMVE